MNKIDLNKKRTLVYYSLDQCDLQAQTTKMIILKKNNVQIAYGVLP